MPPSPEPARTTVDAAGMGQFGPRWRTKSGGRRLKARRLETRAVAGDRKMWEGQHPVLVSIPK